MMNRRASKFLTGAWAGVLLFCWLFAGCHSEPAASGGDSETHFLGACTDSCSGGLSCLCGVCTKPCTDDTSCGALSPAATCGTSCSATNSNACDVLCASDAECSSLGEMFSCNAGRCRQDSTIASGGAGGGGTTGASDAGSGGTAVSEAGSGGTPATSSTCHSIPDLTPSMPAVTELDPELVARAAAVIGSCMGDDGVARNATHIWLAHLAAPRFYYRLAAQLDCFANAGCGCAALEHCLGWIYGPAPADCIDECQGSVFTGCGDGAQATLDCSRLGLGCSPTGTCVVESPAACDATAMPSCTDQGEVLSCSAGAMRKTPCRALGFDCVAGKCLGGGASCTASRGYSGGPELVDPFGTGCSGNTLQACLNGQTANIDCATQGPGFSCQAREGAFFCGLAAECVPADNYASVQPATCDGTTVSFCNAGRLEHLDCTELGFTGCEVDTKVYHYGCTPGPSGQ